MFIDVVFGPENPFQLTNRDGKRNPIPRGRAGQFAFGIVREAMVREPVLHETSRVRMRSREGVDLFLRQVFAVSKDDQRSVNIGHTVYPEERRTGGGWDR